MPLSIRPPAWMAMLAPGMLVAATGVGAGDLLTASMAGAQAGIALLWAAPAGALLKWTLNEGIARWQLGSGTTLLEGGSTRLGAWARWLFLLYFLPWAFMVGAALISACGVAGDAFWPLGEPKTSRILWGAIHSLIGLGLVWIGGFPLFEKAMNLCMVLMFAGVIVTAALLRPDPGEIAATLARPALSAKDAYFALGIMGGVGGTVTLLAYGYWIREAKRAGFAGLKVCRIDLGVAYVFTALFGMAMIFIGSKTHISESGGDVALKLAGKLGEALGPAGRWLFLLGFWGAVFSSLLGVWQSAPYLFADFLAASRGKAAGADLARGWPYRAFLIVQATLPLSVLFLFSVKQIQFTNAVLGALFMPLLALTLLLMNNRQDWVGKAFRNGWIVNLLLIATLVFFVALGVLQLSGKVRASGG